ncbi:hypothetical protein, partial [Escherichia coli]|uniref:hypothetical protein n=1 Tax=Escherichia coli TaxID=562 RepID=UPI00278C3DC4
TELAKSKKENPKWDIAILRRENRDSSRLFQYKIANLIYYPEIKLSDIQDSLLFQRYERETKYKEITVRDKEGLFTYKPMKENTYFKRGDLFSDTK